jgi:tetratricopeptide (TPR) repeat protein
VSAFDRSASLGGVGMWSHYQLGLAYLSMGDVARAEPALIRASEIAPYDEGPYRWLGSIYLQRGDHAEALRLLRTAIDLGSTDQLIWAYLLQAYEEMGLVADLHHTAFEMIDRFPDAVAPYRSLATSLRGRELCPGFVDAFDVMAEGASEPQELLDSDAQSLRNELMVCGLLSEGTNADKY